ncbi:Protein CLEC-52 [Aphelenchoides avenae]|nr:Protein CLEC-52 [Aphelenchus avenae]
MFRRVIVLSVVILFTVSLGYAACPVGYVQGLTPESCYKLINYTVGWSPAEWHCIREGGHLTSVGSAFENNFLRKLAASFNADRFWIGAGSSGPDLWHWNDKSQWTYTNWAPGRPVCEYCWANCVQFEISSGLWYDVDCDGGGAHPYICLIEEEHSAKNRCADDWTYNPTTKMCYQALERRWFTYTWKDARVLCEYKNSTLVSISDRAANFEILRFSREAYVDKTGLFAIGLTYDGATKEWAWLDGTAATFINWAPGYPVKLSGDAATAKPHYVYMRTNGTSASFWENHPWDTPAQGLLCQRPPNN